ncbi:MAG TPA: hypothetical protein VI298_09155 [Geobacteraceae bacterium]
MDTIKTHMLNSLARFVRATICALALVLIPLYLAAENKKTDDPWKPYAERVKIWDGAVAKQLGSKLNSQGPKPYTTSKDGLEATFEKDGAKWTIIAANAPIVSPTEYPTAWTVKGNVPEILVIPEPISNFKILPFTTKIDNAVKSDTISITGAPDSYEPASFVIRSGDIELKNVIVELSDLKAKIKRATGETTAVLPRGNMDVRVVKCWYQAGDQLNDTRHKMLKPELLLHDDDLVRVDYDRQLDLIRNYANIEDAEQLRPFNVPRRQNKQVWLTVHITDSFPSGHYTGRIGIKINGRLVKSLNLDVQINSYVLPPPMINYALYYEGYLSDDKTAKVDSRQKSREQLLNDLIDMREHGLTNATLWHQFSTDKSRWPDDLQRLRQTLDIRKEMGWGTKPLLYLDWKNVAKNDLAAYKEKIQAIIAAAKDFNIKDVYIYGADEKTGNEFAALKPMYKAVHEAGAKNFVSMTEATYLQYGKGLVDIPIFWGIPGIHMKQVDKLVKSGSTIWKYSSPQAGLEEPETYRRVYGLQLLINGFSGACDYLYQRGSWNDFADPNGRMNVMAYPTMSRPVPTLQWEGWRKGVDDVRYATLMKQKGVYNVEWLKANCQTDMQACRSQMIRKLFGR